MGSCFSKKSPSPVVAYGSSSTVKLPPDPNPPCRIDVARAEREREPNSKTASPTRNHQRKEAEQEGFVKKEVFIIKHRKSQDRRASPEEKLAVHHGAAPVADAVKSGEDAAEAVGPPAAASSNGGEGLPVNGASAVCVSAGVRTSSCTKEEVDAILIQCGRLSRSSSGRTGPSSGGRVYSGSKRSYDFDNQNDDGAVARAANASGSERPEMNEDELAEKRQHRQRHRQSTPSRSHSQGAGARRRTPSRERDQRSSSRERRVSRSPARRSENTSLSNSNPAAPAGCSGNGNRPGKMVSVPASLVEKSNCGGDPQESQATVKRISVKRNVGEAHAVPRSAASPRSQSPARQPSGGGGGVGRQQNSENQPSLSRNSSRKAEQSPNRRNPLSEIDTNARQPQPQPHKAAEDRTVKEVEARARKPTVDSNNGRLAHRTCDKNGAKATEDNKAARGCDSAEKDQQAVREVLKRQAPMPGIDREKPQGLARSRSSKLSELELNPQIVPEPTSYTNLLLEDIQNFHQKQTTAFSVPACVTKACSIYEAVADLNSNKSSNAAGSASSESRKAASNQCSHNGYNSSYSGNEDPVRRSEGRDPFVESELAVDDDLMEPSIHKYVTVKRGGLLKGDDKEEIESSGSNSFVGSGTQQWGGVSSSWEPGSADSSDCWTSNSKAVVDDFNPLAFQRIAVSESGRQASESRRDLNVKRRDFGVRQNGIGRSRT